MTVSATTDHKVKVVCRVRPFLPHEVHDNVLQVSECDNSIVVQNQRSSDSAEKFKFDNCYGPEASQEEIFEREVWSVVKNVFNGVNTTVFCYGVTGSGKTHTIQGSEADPGVIPRTIRRLFEESTKFMSYKVSLKFSYLEIYKENVYDLLVAKKEKAKENLKLDIREDSNKNIFISNLSEKEIHDYESFNRMYASACKNRSTASTALNIASSRSHAILIIFISCTDSVTNASRTGKVHLIDLAGSEDNRRTGNGKDRMAESGAINHSLFMLGRVVEALRTGAQHIPFRASKMTRLLQDSLGGQSMAMIIANLAPGQTFYAETINTLNFATKSSQIVNKTVVAEFKEPPKPAEKKYGLNLKLGNPVRLNGGTTGNSADQDQEEQRNAKRQRLSDPSLKSCSNSARSIVGRPGERQRLSEGSAVNARTRGSATGSFSERERIGPDDKNIEKRVEMILEQKVKEMKERGELGSPGPKRILDPLVHQRLTTLEKKLEEQKMESGVDISHLLTPETKLKTAKIHILEAKKFCNIGDLNMALMHYQKAGNLRPDYQKLQQRIEEIRLRIEATAGHDVEGAITETNPPLPAKTLSFQRLPSNLNPDRKSSSIKSAAPSASSSSSFPSQHSQPIFTKHPPTASSSNSVSNPYEAPTESHGVTQAERQPNAKKNLKRPRREDEGDSEEAPPKTMSEQIRERVHTEIQKSDVGRELLTVMNQGQFNEIKGLRGVGKVSAQKIVDYRERQELRQLDDLMKLGFTRNFITKLVESNMDLLS